MAAPTDSARVATNISTAATSHAINVGSPVAGTLLIVYVRFAGDPGTVTFVGGTEGSAYKLRVTDDSDASDDRTSIYWRWANGTEGVSDTLTTSNSIKLGAIAWEVTAAANEEPKISTVATFATTANTGNPNSVAPTLPPQDTLYIVCCGNDGEVGAYTAAPTNYVNLQAANSGTGGAAASNCFMGGASRQITASSSDDAGAFTHAAATNGGTAFALAIRQPPADLPEGTENVAALQAVNRGSVW